MPDFTINIIDGDRPSPNGTTKQRLVLTVDGEQEAVERVTLDSRISITKKANSWSERFGLDADIVVKRLSKLGIDIIAAGVERRSQLESHPAPTQRVSDLAYAWLQSMKPRWHRDARVIRLDAMDAEIRVGSLWSYAPNDLIDQVSHTIEGREVLKVSGGVPIYRTRLAMFRDGMQQAISQVVREIPGFEPVEHDADDAREKLLTAMQIVLTKERSAVTDIGTRTAETIFGWSGRIKPGEGWRQFYKMAVFVRRNKPDELQQVAFHGAFLAAEMRYESSNKLAVALAGLGLVQTDKVVKVTRRPWRVWFIYPCVLLSIAGKVTEVTEEERNNEPQV